MLDSAPRSPLPGVAIVAADRRVRDSLASVLAATGRVEVVGAVADGPTALGLAGVRRPEVILVDPGLVGVADGALLAALRRQAPGARILLVDWDDRSGPIMSRHADGVLDAAGLPGALFDALPSDAQPTD